MIIIIGYMNFEIGLGKSDDIMEDHLGIKNKCG